TKAVSFIEVAKVNIHAVLVKIASGQLPFLGLSCFHGARKGWNGCLRRQMTRKRRSSWQAAGRRPCTRRQ
ncbi:MAG: hypothetical protein FWG56_00200, partial [Desulfovibrionaceae bacterium]|nr:hypothetical protein [Desulfovibrionaceae bacterium]